MDVPPGGCGLSPAHQGRCGGCFEAGAGRLCHGPHCTAPPGRGVRGVQARHFPTSSAAAAEPSAISCCLWLEPRPVCTLQSGPSCLASSWTRGHKTGISCAAACVGCPDGRGGCCNVRLGHTWYTYVPLCLCLPTVQSRASSNHALNGSAAYLTQQSVLEGCRLELLVWEPGV